MKEYKYIDDRTINQNKKLTERGIRCTNLKEMKHQNERIKKKLQILYKEIYEL